MTTLREKLEALIQSKHLLNHSFYTRWQSGKLTLQELQGYAKEYYVFEKEFPRFLSHLHSKCSSPEMRRALLENLMHEECGEENHQELWLRFAEGLGVYRDQVQSHFHSDETHHLVKNFENQANKDGMIAGLAALYAYERQQPEVAQQKMDGLKCFYGIDDESAVQFFKAHQTYDVYHAETEINLLEQLVTNEKEEALALQAAQETLDALYDFLDGVNRRYQPQAA